jgi:cyanophycinase-like exopeptidase
MPGPLVLIGGEEFSPDSNPLNQAVLRAVAEPLPRVALVPTAARDNPRKASRSGESALSKLGSRIEVVMIADPATANDPLASAPFETAEVIYLTDGSPLDAVEILAGSEALNRLHRAWNSGTLMAASGASAMALCDLYWNGSTWEKGLGILQGIVVLPHFEFVIGRFSAARLRRDLPDNYTILGLDDSTGVIVVDQEARVIGPNTVTVYSGDNEAEYTEGTTFSLGTPPG